MDLSDHQTKKLFAAFIEDKKRELAWDDNMLASRVQMSEKTIRRYLGDEMPSVISDNTYQQFLRAVSSNHSEFKQYCEQSRASIVEGLTQVSAQQLSDNATIRSGANVSIRGDNVNSPINTHGNVSYGKN